MACVVNNLMSGESIVYKEKIYWFIFSAGDHFEMQLNL